MFDFKQNSFKVALKKCRRLKEVSKSHAHLHACTRMHSILLYNILVSQAPHHHFSCSSFCPSLSPSLPLLFSACSTACLDPCFWITDQMLGFAVQRKHCAEPEKRRETQVAARSRSLCRVKRSRYEALLFVFDHAALLQSSQKQRFVQHLFNF